MSDEIIKSFVSLGLSEQKAKETLKNANVTKILTSVINAVNGIGVIVPDGGGLLLYHLATKWKPQIDAHLLLYLTKMIAGGKLDCTLRVDKAIEYCLCHLSDWNEHDFSTACGIGITVTPEQIEKSVEIHLAQVKDELIEKRYKYNVGLVMQKVRVHLPWADGKAIKNELDLQILDLLGPKTAVDLAPTKKITPISNKSKQMKTISNNEKESASLTIVDVIRKLLFHKPGENYKTDGYIITPNTMELLRMHLQQTNGKVRTRFPPEPNGILHIGHAKAININFGYAAAHDGICYLRYDDTNPEKEEEKFFTAILDMIRWLGYKPAAVTHSSDYFQQLYEWAFVLIEHGLAYVCHQTADEMKGFQPEPSPWRNRPRAESAQLFTDMRNGKLEEGAATLRLKLTLEEGKVDPVAYRIRFTAHHRTGDKWCVYPTYDYTHCLCDSLENITHSLCTKEFQTRRSSYYWLCNALNIYCPVQWEFGRLNINYTIVSKRKIAQLIQEKIVSDWDDPRLFTLTALRRRGFPPEAINNFCAQLGVTGAQSVVDPSMLEAYVRDTLNNIAPRTMVILEPLKVTLESFPSPLPITVSVADFPNKPNDGATHTITFDRVLYIERNDFMKTGTDGYRRLTETQSVGLRYAGCVINVIRIETDSLGNVVHLICNCTKVDENKPKAFIHWVAQPILVQVRLYQPLFNHKNPEDAPGGGGFLTDCNLNSLKVLPNCYADASLVNNNNVQVFDKFQFERTGYFSVDPDSNLYEKKLVFNQTVGLKEDLGK